MAYSMDPARHYPRRDFSMIIITVPSRFGLMAFKVTSRRTGALAIRPSMWRISWGDPEVPENSRVISEHLIQRVEAFTQRMWGNQGGYSGSIQAARDGYWMCCDESSDTTSSIIKDFTW
ncbi:hypothetical protein PSTT_06320 [Puccinia striiformis]|uniref:Uncharacterized protein n=1 Tax=Puccinia striiformis TaxID=27350 RepID=A0A2S4VL78_9BASI|nr:hypothetical protein PSTT_06320 [Puccinia striiformis]